MAYSDNGMRSQGLPPASNYPPRQQPAPYFPPPPREEFSQCSDAEKQYPRQSRQSQVRKFMYATPAIHVDKPQYPPPPVGQYASSRNTILDQRTQQNVASRSLVVSGQPSLTSELAPYDTNIAQAHLPPPPPGPPSQDAFHNHGRRPAGGPLSDSEYGSDDSDYDDTRRRRRSKRSKRDESPSARNPLGSKGHRFTSEDKGLMASTLGGAGGALLGSSAGGGVVGVVGGLLAGAIGASKLEDRHEKKKSRRKDEQEIYARKYYSDDGGKRSRRSRRHADDGHYSDDY